MSAAEALFPDDFLLKIERLALAARRERGEGAAAGERRGGRVEFADHRPYVPGDDLRYVDWHLYGRQGELFLKEFAREEEAEVVLVLDASASMARRFRGALRLAAALLAVGLAKGDRVRFGTAADGGLRLGRPLSGEGRRAELIAQIAAWDGQAGGGTDLDASLAALPRRTGPGRRLLIVVSDLLAARDGRGARAGGGEDLTILHWLGPEERHPPAAGLVTLVDAEGGEVPAFLGQSEVAAYREALRAWLADVRAAWARRGARCLLVPAEAPVEDLLLGLLLREGVVG